MKDRLQNYPLHESMRGYWGRELYEAMLDDKKLWVLTGDLGFGLFAPHQSDFPNRFINCGASELAMMAIACGLSREEQRPITYTISSFYLRAAEPIALYVARERLPIIMVGSGRNADYHIDGPSHNGTNAQNYMNMLGIRSFYPEQKEEIKDVFANILRLNEPVFLSLRK